MEITAGELFTKKRPRMYKTKKRNIEVELLAIINTDFRKEFRKP